MQFLHTNYVHRSKQNIQTPNFFLCMQYVPINILKKKTLEIIPMYFISYSYEAALAGYILECVFKGKVGVPFWFLYVVTIAKFLIVLNASGNFIIYLATGSTFRATFFKQIASVGKKFRQRN